MHAPRCCGIFKCYQPATVRNPQAIFMVSLAGDLDPNSLKAVLAARGNALAGLLESLQQECKLRVAYSLASSTSPSVRLHLPPTLESRLGARCRPCDLP